MTTAPTKRPNFLARLFQRATWIDGDGNWDSHDGRYDMLSGPGYSESPAMRRQRRTEADLVAVMSAVYACVRIRTRMITKPVIKLVQVNPAGEIVDELPNTHPAFQPLYEVNASLTRRHGFGLIEQHKLTAGKGFWVKRRNRLGTPVDFEVWDPRAVAPVPDPKMPWVPLGFKRRTGRGTEEFVALKDVIWFRHMIDPRNPLEALGPIGAVRVQVDTGLEAQRYNQAYFDNSTNIGHFYKVPDAGPGEVERIRADLKRSHQGTDNAFRNWISEGDIEEVGTAVTHEDMQFLEQQQWTVEETARVFELSPVSIGDLRRATYENADQSDAKDWAAIQDQLDNTLDEFTEFYLWVDFDRSLRFIADYSEIHALQPDLKLRAEIDEIHLRTGRSYINELRQRDGEEPVPWGDVPLMPINVAPLGQMPTISVEQEPEEMEEPRSRALLSVDEAEMLQRRGWERRLGKERDAITRHLVAAARALRIDDVESYDWDWSRRYGPEVMAEIEFAYAAGLIDASFMETPLTPAQRIASLYARQRGAELLRLGDRNSVVDATREGVRKLVAQAIEDGQGIPWLRQQLQQSFAFSPSRAQTIARTETATAQGKATLQAYQSLGHEGKRWIAEASADGICLANEQEGVLAVGRHFNSGHAAPPAHPNCRCALSPVRHLPRSIRRTVERDGAGRMAAVLEEEMLAAH